MSHYYTNVFKEFKPTYLEINGAIDKFLKSFSATGLLVCGESHGVRENADLAYTLCKLIEVKQIAIERSETHFRNFIESAIKGTPNFLSPQALQSIQSSVLSIEMLKAIVTLFNQKCITKIQFVDIDSLNNPSLKTGDIKQFMQTREQEIAKNIIKSSTDPILAILGSFHTHLETDDIEFDSALKLIRDKKPATYLKYNYLSGSQYNSGRILKFNNRLKEGKNNTINIYQESNNNFVIEIPKATMIKT